MQECHFKPGNFLFSERTDSEKENKRERVSERV